jgi:small RNA 2'-O-methyltransferase
MLLGMYHPRLLLITTPSYTFNSRFTAPDAPEGARKGILDPTGRTNRIFRHWDHKFEWIVEEFKAWCEEVAEKWEYEVEVAGIGMPMEKDPFGRDEQLGKATQVAVFTRKEGELTQATREQRCAELGMTNQRLTDSTQPHQLLKHYHHEADSPTSNGGSLEEIGQLVLERMKKYNLQEMPLTEMWAERDVSVMCEGWLQRLIAAVKATSMLTLHKAEGKGLSNWSIMWEGFLPAAVEDDEDALRQGYNESLSPIVWADVEGWGANDDFNGTGWGPWGSSWETTKDDTWNVETVPEAITGIA